MRSLKLILQLFCIQCTIGLSSFCFAGLPAQVDVDRAKHSVDAHGIPNLTIEGVGEIIHPAFVAIYALAYADEDAYDKSFEKLADKNKFIASVNWLEKNLKQNGAGFWVWTYDFDNTYNDVSIKAPWHSAFAQAVGIEAFLAAHKTTGDKKYLELAKKAAEVLFVPIAKGGLLFEKGDDIWFEEIPFPSDNPSHILNGHMRTLIAIKKLSDVTNDKTYTTYFKRGLDTLIKWLPKYDTGYWLRYDLNPRKTELCFRFNNPYGNKLTPLAIHKIILRDPLTQKENVLSLGSKGDSEGDVRFAGNDWGQPEVLDQKSIRRLLPVSPSSYQEQLDGETHHKPGTYFYQNLPTEWTDNLRSDWFELVVVYKDEQAGNVSLQMRSIAPGPAFQWMKNGDLHLTGSGEWREWRIPVRPSDLGFFCGASYGDKHLRYLEKLADSEPKLKPWVSLAKGYLNTFDNEHPVETVKLEQQVLPLQTSPLTIIGTDVNGLLCQFFGGKNTRFNTFGVYSEWDGVSDIEPPIHNIFVIAEQARLGIHHMFKSAHTDPNIVENKYVKKYGVQIVTKKNYQDVKREPAYKYLLKNSEETKNGALLWPSNYYNAYNDVEIRAGWSSAFSQAYVIKALRAAIDDKIENPKADYRKILKQAMMAYFVPISENGFLVKTHYDLPFFQEFSISPHSVINAHLVSLSSIKESIQYEPMLIDLYKDSLNTLREHIYLFDAGYWLRYDLNPKKELLCQIDWIEGERSPLIESIALENPQTEKQTHISVNSDQAFAAYPSIGGTDWSMVETDDNRVGRGFVNGYKRRNTPVDKGAHHNVYFTLALPTREFENDFIIPSFKLRIQYKDVSPGKFQLKIKPLDMNNHHTFVLLREGHIVCTGDQQWKEVTISIHPRELGWFVGPDYQQFHFEQLALIGEQTKDWFFKQLAIRHQHFFNLNKEGISPFVVEVPSEFGKDVPEKKVTETPEQKVISGVSIREASPTYEGHGFDISINGDPSKSYVAGMDGEKLSFVEFDLEKVSDIKAVEIVWENENNFARNVKILTLLENSSPQEAVLDQSETRKNTSVIQLNKSKGVKRARIEFSDFAGQSRLLLRQIRFTSN